MIATIEYVYDGNGNRYSKTITPSGGTPSTRYYSYDTGGNIVSEYKRVILNGSEESQTLVRYIRDTGGKAISMIQGTNTYYFIYNGHGDVTALTDSSGTVVATYSYDEFGNSSTDDRQPTTDIYNPIRYSGAHNAYYDSETGLYKMGTRYYQPDVGRWLTRDQYQGEKEEPQTQNRYVYVSNNPINGVDPTGHWKDYAHASMTSSIAHRLGFNWSAAKWLGSMNSQFDHTENAVFQAQYHFNTFPWPINKYKDTRKIHAKYRLDSATKELRSNQNIQHPDMAFDSALPLIAEGAHMLQDIDAHHNLHPLYHLGTSWPDIPSEHIKRHKRDCFKVSEKKTSNYLKVFKRKAYQVNPGFIKFVMG